VSTVPIAITNIAVFSGLQDSILGDAAIVIGDDGRVAEIVPRARLSPSLAASAIDGQGATALPGLIDMHTHVMGATPDELQRPGSVNIVASQVIRGLANAARCVSRGVTTIRDAGAASPAIFTLKESVERGDVPGPRMVLAGSALTMTGGHGSHFSVEADGVDGLRKAARLQIKNGAECIKLIASSGASAPCGCLSGLQLSPEEMASAVKEAKRAGLHTLAHAIPAQAVMEALQSGVDSIEHGIFLDRETVQAMKAAGVHYTPTLAIFSRIARNAPPASYPPHMVAKAQLCVEAHRASFQLAVEARVPMLAGTDAGNWGWRLGDLADELVLMNDYGLPAFDCLQAATHEAAKFLGRGDSVGSLQPGHQADILLVRGNPLENLAALYDVQAVFKGGRKF
jgi:imidazolonepropionase-like amidohydrolase